MLQEAERMQAGCLRICLKSVPRCEQFYSKNQKYLTKSFVFLSKRLPLCSILTKTKDKIKNKRYENR